MKKIGMLALGLATGLGLMSCYLDGFKTGSMSMDFSGFSGNRAIQNGYVARVYLLADGLLFSTGGGTPFAAEVEVDQYVGATVKIDGLPVGPVYKALVGFGPVTDGVFSPEYYGESPRFQITPGGDTATSVAMQYPPFNIIRYSVELMTRNIKDVGNNFAGMIAAEETRVYYTNLYYDSGLFQYLLSAIGPSEQYDLAVDPGSKGVSSLRINGLSAGTMSSYFTTWLNTNDGIVPFSKDTWIFQTDFSSTLTGSRDILESGSFQIVAASLDFLFFRRANGLGGVAAANGVLSPTWINLDVPGVKAMAIGASSAFFATDGGAFALPPAFLQDAAPTLAAYRKSFSAPAPIQALGVRSGAPSMVYMGTTDGIWFASMDETNYEFGVDTPLDRILETAGEPIDKIAVSTWATISDNQAYLSRYWLFIKTYGSVYKIPFYAVFPGKPTGIAWDSNHNLYISGTGGLAAVYVGGS